MFSRYCLLFCVIAILTVIITAESEELDLSGIDVEERGKIPKKLLKAGVKALRGSFVGASASCLVQTAHHCKAHLNHIHALIDCARGFAHTNKGRCLIG